MRRHSVLALVVCLWIAAPALADRVDQHVPIGTAAAGTVDAPGDLTTLGFLVSEGAKRKVSLTLKRAKRSNLELDVTLVAPDGSAFDLAAAGGKVKNNGKVYKAKLNDVPDDMGGLWRLEVRGANGTAGEFNASVKAKDLTSLKSSVVVAVGGSASAEFQAGDGVVVSVSAKRSKGSNTIPDLAIIDPNGNVLPESVGAAAVNSKKGTAKLKKFSIPTFGAYRLRVTGSDATGGGVAFSLKTKPAKFKGTLPVADPGASFEVEPGLEGRLTGSAGTGAATFLWTQVSGTPVDLTNADSAFPMFDAPTTDGTLAFQLAVTKGGVQSRPAAVSVEVGQRPIAVPGPSRRVTVGADVVLDGSGSLDRDGMELQHAWRVVESDTTVTLTDPATASPTVSAESAGIARLGLIVDNGTTRSFESEQLVVFGDAPGSFADAGREQYVSRMATVHLSGLYSERATGVLDDGALWTQLSGPAVELAEADTFHPSFTATRTTADLLFELRVDGQASTAARAWVRVRPDETNLPPATRTVGHVVPSGGSASLDARPTADPDGDARAYKWAQTVGVPATLTNSDAAVAGATGLDDAGQLWSFTVQSRDDLAYGPPDLVIARGASFSGRPIANAGADVAAPAGSQLQLNGSASLRTDGGTDPLTFAWRQASGTDWFDVAALDPSFDPTAERPEFTVSQAVSSLTPTRTISFELVVNDGANDSLADRVTATITGLPLNGVPHVTADATDTNPIAGSTVGLLGTAEDLDGDPVTVSWIQISGPVVALDPGKNVLAPEFDAPSSGTLVFQLFANDGFDDSAPAEVTIVVDARPIAVATVTPPSGDVGTQVTFSAANSSDPENKPLTYFWSQASGTPATFDASAESFVLTSPAGGFSFQLFVSDGRQSSLAVSATFTDEPPLTTSPVASVSNAAYGQSVTLTSNPNLSDGTTYSWRQVNPGPNLDPTVTLSSLTAQNPTFSVPLPTTSPFGATPSATFGITATRKGQITTEKTVKVSFFASLNNTSLAGSGNTVYPIISTKCSICHTGTNNSCPVGSGKNASGFGMNSKSAFLTNAVNVTACSSSKKRVDTSTSSATASYLIDRLKGIGGAQMPTSGSITTTQRNLIEDWVSQGGKDN